MVPVAVLTLAANVHHSSKPETIIALERAALDRWGKGDPQGYLELYAPDITYFDPMQERRIDGLATMQKLYGPIKGLVKVDSFKMIEPRVQEHGDVALLTFNLVSHARNPAGEPMAVRWNSTEVYRRSRGKWSIIHSHWSFTKPGA
jgi:ketosteroid isomerase-like protein